MPFEFAGCRLKTGVHPSRNKIGPPHKWLKETSARNGVSMEKLVREQIGKAISTGGKRRSLRHAGELRGPADLSSLRTDEAHR